jgi:hypothetical protein
MKLSDISYQLNSVSRDYWENELLRKVEQKFGKRIKTKGDASQLSLELLKEKNISISVSTIRRIYGLLPQRNKSVHTLNGLSRYISFNSFDDYVEFKQKISASFLSINSNTELLETAITLISEDNPRFDQILIFALLTKQALDSGDEDLLEVIFTSTVLRNTICFNEDLHDLFTQIISASVFSEKYVKQPSILIDYVYFQELFLSRYVDTENEKLEKFYKVIIEVHPTSSLFNLACSVLSFNAIMNGKFKEGKRWFDLIRMEEINNVELSGRVALLKKIYLKKDKNWLLETIYQNQNNLHLYLIDIVAYHLKIKDKEFLSGLFTRFKIQIFEHQKLVSPSINKLYLLGFKFCGQLDAESETQESIGLNSNSTYSRLKKQLE